jgi:hypothetical protein
VCLNTHIVPFIDPRGSLLGFLHTSLNTLYGKVINMRLPFLGFFLVGFLVASKCVAAHIDFSSLPFISSATYHAPFTYDSETNNPDLKKNYFHPGRSWTVPMSIYNCASGSCAVTNLSVHVTEYFASNYFQIVRLSIPVSGGYRLIKEFSDDYVDKQYRFEETIGSSGLNFISIYSGSTGSDRSSNMIDVYGLTSRFRLVLIQGGDNLISRNLGSISGNYIDQNGEWIPSFVIHQKQSEK